MKDTRFIVWKMGPRCRALGFEEEEYIIVANGPKPYASICWRYLGQELPSVSAECELAWDAPWPVCGVGVARGDTEAGQHVVEHHDVCV